MGVLGKLWPSSAWRRVVVAALLCALIVATLCATTRLDERLAERLIGRQLGADATIDALQWRLDGRLCARGVHFAFPSEPSPFFGAERIDLELGLLPPRIEAVVLVRPRLVATEGKDGRIDLESLRHGGGSPARLPALTIEGGEIELRGDGPLRARLRGVLADAPQSTLAIERLRLFPQATTDRWVVDGVVELPGIVRVHLDGALEGGRLVRLVARVSEQDAIDVVAIAPRLAPSIASWMKANAMSGRIAPRVTLAWSGDRLDPSADVELCGVTMTPAVFPTTVSELRGWVRLRDGNLVLDELNGNHAGAAMSVRGVVRDLAGAVSSHTVVRIDAATVDDELRHALAGDAIGSKVLAALVPEGRYSATATIDTGPQHAAPYLVLDLDLEECAAVFHGFADEQGHRSGLPIRVERIRGDVHVAPDLIAFDRCVGFTRGGARVEASARMDEKGLVGTAQVFAAPIDEELLTATDSDVDPAIRALVSTLGAKGRFDASAHFALPPGKELELTLELEPRALDLDPPSFPYHFTLDGGRVHVDHAGVRIDGVNGTAGSGSLRVDGEIALPKKGEHDLPLSVTVTAQHLTIDPPLLLACHALEDSRISALLEPAAPRGDLDVEVRWARATAGAPVDLALRFAPRDLSLTVGAGTAVARRMTGAVTFTRHAEEPWQIDLESEQGLSMHLFDGIVRITGKSDEEGGGRLQLSGEGIVLGAELRAALAPLAPELVAILASHAIEGCVRVHCDLEPRDRRLAPVLVDIEPDQGHLTDGDPVTDDPRGVSFTPPWLALPLRWLGGAMHVDLDEGRVSFDRLDGRLGDAHLSIGAGGVTFEEGAVTTRLSADLDALPFGQWIELVFGTERWRAMLPYGPLGRTHATVRELVLRQSRDGSVLERVETRGDIDFDGWTFYTGGGLRELTGQLQILNFTLERKDGGITDVRADGRLAGVTLDVGVARFANLECDLLLAEGRLSAPWISAEFAGGRLLRERNHLGIALLGEMPFEGRLELDSGDVSRLAGDDQPRMRELIGRVDADVGFRGNGLSLFHGRGIAGLEAAGRVAIVDAKLWKIPLFDMLNTKAVLKLIGPSGGEGGTSEPPKWERGEVDFALQGAYVRLSKVELEGEPLVLRGEGTLGPDRLAINFYPEVRTGIGWVRDFPVLGWVLDPIFSLLEREVGAFRFQGPYGNPEVVWDPVSLVPRPDLTIQLERPRTSSRDDDAVLERF